MVAEKYQIRPGRIAKWNDKLNKGQKLCANDGRPKKLSSNEMDDISKMIRQGVDQKHILSVEQVATAFKEKVSAASKGGQTVSDRTIRRWKCQLGFRTMTVEPTTEARRKAVLDVLNALSLIVMLQVVLLHVKHAPLIVNYDSTQFAFGGGTRNTKGVVPEGLDHAETVSGSGMLNDESIKYYAIMSAAGIICSSIVLVVADENMAKEDISVHKVHTLSISAGVDGVGYVVFCRSRCGNAAFFQWFNVVILGGFLTDIKAQIGVALDTPCFVCCDGEAAQIKSYNDLEVTQCLHDHHCIVGKLPAATTAVSQPCDAGNYFKTCKSLLRSATPQKVGENSYLRELLTKIFNEQQQRFPGKRRNATRTIDGIINIRYAIQKGARSNILLDSFCKSGLTGMSVDVIKILNNHSVTVTNDEYQDIMLKLPDLTKKFDANGSVSDKELKQFNIGVKMSTDAKDKSLYCLNRQRAVFVMR